MSYALSQIFLFPKFSATYYIAILLMGLIGFREYGFPSLIFGAIASVLMAISLKSMMQTLYYLQYSPDKARLPLNLALVFLPLLVALPLMAPMMEEACRRANGAC